jgi:signal transduction histidine kinase
LADVSDSSNDWVGRLVRVIVVFRTFVLLVTLITLPSRDYRPVVATAMVAAALISWLPIRHWDRISATVSRHPAYLAVEILISAFVLAAGGVRGPFFYFTLGTAVLAGVIYGRRGAFPFSALLISVYQLVLIEGLPSGHPQLDAQTVLFAPLLYPLAVAAGITARDMIERGARAEGLLHQRTVALGAERERLRVARELHDSLAKTVEGLAMSASVLPSRCTRDPGEAAELARGLVVDARQAALEARMLMADLRPGAAAAQSLHDALRARVRTFAERAGVEVELTDRSRSANGRLSQPDIHELLRIVGEGMTNAVTHGQATRLEVALHDDVNGELIVNIIDNGGGLAEPVDLEALKAAGHFGIAGMHERARSIGATLLIERGEDGATVSVRLPPSSAEQDVGELASHPGRRRWPIRRRRAALEPQAATKEAS